MMRSMYAGVAGLKTHQTRMDVIGNNIANVNTVAYKSQSMTFAELMYQTTQRASGPNATTGTGGINARQIGLGVKTSAINTNIAGQGAAQTTNNPFDIMITGDAFFIVSNGSENFFTRDGSFYVDAVGNLAMTSNGYNVMGWQVDKETMTIKEDTVSPLRIMSPENMENPPEATTLGYLSGILDKNDTNVTSTSGKNINFQFYDSLGYSYTARLNLKSTDTEGVYALELGAVLDENNEKIDISAVEFGTRETVERQGSVRIKEG
ncbi:MAG: flagellar hook-basal body complex protein, partial [Lachnospiraceae bacterium]|nr:flagellar hook-basal body complex protein [Lachnospiraceae bacterium]